MRSFRSGFGIAVLAGGLLATGCGSADTSSAASTATPLSINLVRAGTLTVGSDISYAPQEFYDPPGSNTVKGMDYDIAKALADKLGLQLNFVNHSFGNYGEATDIFSALTSKQFDILISAVTITDQRKGSAAFIPYFSAGESFLVVKAGTYQPKTFADLCGHRVSVQAGTIEETELNGTVKAQCGANAPTVISKGVDPDSVSLVKSGGADVDFTDSPVASYDAKSDPTLTVSSGVLEVAPEGIAVRKDDSTTLAVITSAFNQIKADGTYQKILDKWGLTSGAL